MNLTGKKYTENDLADEEIPWTYKNNRFELFELLKNSSQMHLPANKSSINWGGVPDSLVEKMKQQKKMPSLNQDEFVRENVIGLHIYHKSLHFLTRNRGVVCVSNTFF